MKIKKRYLTLIILLLIFSIGGYYLSGIKTFRKVNVVTINFPAMEETNTFINKDYQLSCFAQSSSDKVRLKSHYSYQLMVWNIFKGKSLGWQKTLQNYAQSSDFLLLQEATSNNQIPQQLSNAWYGVHGSAFAYRGDQSGLLLLSHFLPNRYCVASSKEPWIKIPKVVEALYYPIENSEPLLMINLHLINFEWRPQRYAEQLAEMFKLIQQHTGPIILAGDFNSWREARLSLLLELAKNSGLTQVVFEPDHRLQFMDYPLDHIFVRGVNVEKAWTEETESSDHNPLFLRFSIK